MDQGHVILDHAALEQAHQAQQALEHQGLASLSGLDHVPHPGLEHQVEKLLSLSLVLNTLL